MIYVPGIPGLPGSAVQTRWSFAGSLLFSQNVNVQKKIGSNGNGGAVKNITEAVFAKQDSITPQNGSHTLGQSYNKTACGLNSLLQIFFQNRILVEIIVKTHFPKTLI